MQATTIRNTYFKARDMNKLTTLFILLGTLGTLIPLPIVPMSFRFYYLILPLGAMLFLAKGIRKSTLILLCLSLPLFTYMLTSSWYAFVNPISEVEASHENPFLRLGLLFFLFVFTLLASDNVKYKSSSTKFKYILVYLTGYFISLVFGYIFFIGYYLGKLPLQFISEFQVLTQFGSGGLLRFSPGSYPNEYGNVSSFVLSVLTLFFVFRSQLKEQKIIFHKKMYTFLLSFLYILTLGALFLATTRSAYISFVITLIYIILSQKNSYKISKITFKIVFFFGLLYLLVQNFLYDINSIFYSGYISLFNKDASAYDRVIRWNAAYENFQSDFLFGIGFSTVAQVHNTYLQFLFELGLLGTFFLIITLFSFLYLLWNPLKGFYQIKNNNVYDFLLWKVGSIGVIHVLWFATNNHNLNHHLTWYTIFLILICVDGDNDKNCEV